MNAEINVRNWDRTIRWVAGAAILGYGVYKLLKSGAAREAIDLEPALHPAEAHPYFDTHPHRPHNAPIPKTPVSNHRTHMGNGPGERNQIGGRASGKKAR